MENQSSWCQHGEETSQVEEERKDAVEVGPQANAAEDAQDEAEEGIGRLDISLRRIWEKIII